MTTLHHIALLAFATVLLFITRCFVLRTRATTARYDTIRESARYKTDRAQMAESWMRHAATAEELEPDLLKVPRLFGPLPEQRTL